MIICAGESLVDVLPSEVEGMPETAVPGGGPMNAAVAAARLGVPTAFVGRISTDSYGDLIWSHLEASGVDLRAAQRGQEPTARAIVTTKPVQTFRFEGEHTADESMTSFDLAPLGPGPHLLHSGTLGVFRGETAATLGRLLEIHDGAVSFDPNIRPKVFPSQAEWLEVAEPWLERADVIKASDEDLDWMGLTIEDLLARHTRAVLRTAGGSGVDCFLASGQRFSVPAHQAPVVDTVGAGDSFCGAVLSGLYRRRCVTSEAVSELAVADWTEIVTYAVTAAAITVSRVGADPPWLSEMPNAR